MKPLDRDAIQAREAPTNRPERKPKGKSGRGAASALEHLIHEERVRVLHRPHEEPKERLPSEG